MQRCASETRLLSNALQLALHSQRIASQASLSDESTRLRSLPQRLKLPHLVARRSFYNFESTALLSSGIVPPTTLALTPLCSRLKRSLSFKAEDSASPIPLTCVLSGFPYSNVSQAQSCRPYSRPFTSSSFDLDLTGAPLAPPL